MLFVNEYKDPNRKRHLTFLSDFVEERMRKVDSLKKSWGTDHFMDKSKLFFFFKEKLFCNLLAENFNIGFISCYNKCFNWNVPRINCNIILDYKFNHSI